jgi:tetratricopeptide (TPR) repeat protein
MIKNVSIAISFSVLCLALPLGANAQISTSENEQAQERLKSLLQNQSDPSGLTARFNERHKECLERIADDPELAFEGAMIWRSEGGGRRAKHCEAMALFALGHESEAAHRLDKLAKAADGGSPEMRANFYSEAANFWLAAEETHNAYTSASEGLKLKKDHLDLRISRARAYAMQGYFDYAEIDLTSVLAFDPKNADALRYRADARLKQGELDAALQDIETALSLNPESVETALLRGRIKETIRTSQSQNAE